MPKKKIPTFKANKDAAKFWDKTDATEYMEGGTLGEFIWEETDDRCNYCGNKMKPKVRNINLLNGKVTIRKVKRYQCPSCGRERLAREFKDKIPFITKDLVEMGLRF